MRPSVDEQLRGTCRILEEVVAPSVGDPYARTILAGLIANLRMLNEALPAVAGFLRHDNQACGQLLAVLAPALPVVLSAPIAQALDQPEPDPADAAALERRNQALRELLAQAVGHEDLTTEHHALIRRHLTERASRVPMRYVPTAPAAPQATPSPAH
jgi:hypothetical protein